MVRIEMSRASRRNTAWTISKSTQKSSSPRKKSCSQYLTPNIIIFSFNFHKYHLEKLNIYMPRVISSSSVTKDFRCFYGRPITLATGTSVSPTAYSRVNLVSWINSTTCWSSALSTRRGSSSLCCVPSWGTVFPHFICFWWTFISVRSWSEGILIHSLYRKLVTMDA